MSYYADWDQPDQPQLADAPGLGAQLALAVVIALSLAALFWGGGWLLLRVGVERI